MEIGLAAPTPEPAWPSGARARRAEVAAEAAAIHALLTAAYEGTEDVPPPFPRWLDWWTSDPEFDPALWFVADADGAIAGAALCWSSAFVKDLAVATAHRRRGIGRALLLTVFQEFRARGAPAVSLKVDADNPTGARRLYEAAGMRVVGRIGG